MHLRNYLFILIVVLSIDVSFSQEKLNGLSFVSPNNAMDPNQIVNINAVNANSVAVSPFSFTKGLKNPNLKYDSPFQWEGERPSGVREMIQIFHKNNITVLLKPQIWVWNGSFCGHIQMETEEDWLIFEEKYTEYILEFAQIAEEENVAIFSIGTELNNFVRLRPKYWIDLIHKVRKVYSGKLTYAANWDAYDKFRSWGKLDYIGIDQYFPLSDKAAPSPEELDSLWKPYVDELQAFSTKHNKPIIFPEFGYRSVDYCTQEPWDFSQDHPLNMETQSTALQAVFRNLWDEPWFAGGFLWKWFDDYENVGGVNNDGYTPQNKPAEKTVGEHYKLYQ